MGSYFAIPGAMDCVIMDFRCAKMWFCDPTEAESCLIQVPKLHQGLSVCRALFVVTDDWCQDCIMDFRDVVPWFVLTDWQETFSAAQQMWLFVLSLADWLLPRNDCALPSNETLFAGRGQQMWLF